MAYKNLLVHIDDSKACAERLDVAIALAQAHSAHLTGLYIAADPVLPGGMSAEVPVRFLDTLRAQVSERSAAAEAGFVAALERAGLTADCRTTRCPASRAAEVVALNARYADLVILGQPEPEARGEVNA